MSIEPENTDEMNADISPEERAFLDDSIENGLSSDHINLTHAVPDNTDDEGDFLNEAGAASDHSGSELDIPGAELDDENESIGEEDEENNGYSHADTE